MAQAQYSNLGGAESLWVDHTVNRGEFTIATCGGANTNNATIRWYQANVTGGTVAANVVQGATFDPDGANTFFRFMPGLAVDRVGDMAIGYTKSNATTNPQIKYAGRLAGDPVNTLDQSEQTLIDGTGAQSGNCGGAACTRWGDYSGMSLDPNGCEFWMTGEYYATNGLNDLTRIGSFHYPGCTPVGNGTLSGTVTDGANPISGATITLGNRTTTTDGSGAYSFTRPGRHLCLADGGQGRLQLGLGLDDRRSGRRHGDQNFTLSTSAQSGCFTDNTQSTFQRGAPANCDLVKSPGNVVLANPDNTRHEEQRASARPASASPTPAGPGRRSRRRSPGSSSASMSSCSAPAAPRTSPNITLSIRSTTGATPVPTGADLATRDDRGLQRRRRRRSEDVHLRHARSRVTAGYPVRVRLPRSAAFAQRDDGLHLQLRDDGLLEHEPVRERPARHLGEQRWSLGGRHDCRRP